MFSNAFDISLYHVDMFWISKLININNKMNLVFKLSDSVQNKTY